MYGVGRVLVAGWHDWLVAQQRPSSNVTCRGGIRVTVAASRHSARVKPCLGMVHGAVEKVPGPILFGGSFVAHRWWRFGSPGSGVMRLVY